jgi:hypothetical protein
MHISLLRWSVAAGFLLLSATPVIASEWDATAPFALPTMVRGMATTDAAGNSYVVDRPSLIDPSPQGATISRIARNGGVVWTKPVSAQVLFHIGDAAQANRTQIAANAHRVCFHITNTSRLNCHAASDGALLPQIVLPERAYDSLELNSDDQILLRQRLSGAAPALVLDAGNAVLPSSSYTAAMLAPRLYSSAGYELHFDNATATSINGIRRESRHTPATTPALTWQIGGLPATLPDGQPAVFVFNDGSALALLQNASPFSPSMLRRLNADGSLGYQKSLSFDNDNGQISAQVLGELIVITRFLDSSYQELITFSLQDGSERWRQVRSTGYAEAPSLSPFVAEPGGTHGVWWTVDGVDFNARRIRLADGAEVARTDFPCADTPCHIDDARSDIFGVTLLPDMNRRERAMYTGHVRADQEALEGTWYQPQISGQGILFDYFPEQRTWFGTWHFHWPFDPFGGSIPTRSGLYWYTLQGVVSADGRQVDLGVYASGDGKFNDTPRTASGRVGDATLTFDSCGAATLNYRIELEFSYVISGSIPLQALTPASTQCAGIGQPLTPSPVTEFNGISSRFSGTWYNPETSGQGFSASIRPGASGGVVFAGWFTYDPVLRPGNSDSPYHWFTLQGDLSAASNGSVTLPIFQTLGGSFDSYGTHDTQRLGEATWRFIDCNHSELSYQFADTGISNLFSGLSGTIPLQRLGACPAQ